MKKKSLTISLPPVLIEYVDKIADRFQISKSETIRHMIIEYKSQGQWKGKLNKDLWDIKRVLDTIFNKIFKLH